MKGIGVDGHLGRRRRRESEGVQGVRRPVSTPSAPAHPSWRPEPRQRSRSRPASPKPRATSVGPGGTDPAGALWATRAKRRREGGGRSGARTPTRAEPAGEAGRAWDPGAPVAGPPPATAECPRCLPAGPPRKALSLRQPPRRLLPAPRPYNRRPAALPAARRGGSAAAQPSAKPTPGPEQVGSAGTRARARNLARGSEARVRVSGSPGDSRVNAPGTPSQWQEGPEWG